MSGAATAAGVACVLPVGGRSALLDGCLAALRAQDEPPGEVLVVDDSADGSLGDLPGVRVVHSGGRGPYAARNVGWRATRADIVLFLDVRSRPRPAWARRMAGAFHEPHVALAGSDVRVLGGPSPAERVAEHQQNFRLANYLTATFFRPYLPTCNLGVRREDLVAVGGFGDVRSGGDADFCWRVLQRPGRTLEGVDEVLMDWVPRTRLRDLFEQYYRYGRSNHALRRSWAAEGAPQAEPLAYPVLARRAAAAGIRMAAAAARGRDNQFVEQLAGAAFLANQLGYRVAADAERRRGGAPAA